MPQTHLSQYFPTQGVKEPSPEFHTKCNVNDAAVKNEPLNLLYLQKQGRKSGQIKRNCSQLKKRRYSNFNRAEISTLCKGDWRLQIHRCLGHTQNMRTACSLPPSRPCRTPGTRQPHRSLKTKQTESMLGFSKQQGRGKGWFTDDVKEESVLNWEEMLISDGPFCLPDLEISENL